MNRAGRRAAARGHRGAFLSVMLGEPDPECEHCQVLGMVPAAGAPLAGWAPGSAAAQAGTRPERGDEPPEG